MDLDMQQQKTMMKFVVLLTDKQLGVIPTDCFKTAISEESDTKPFF